jgi:acetyl-CoA synthetase (ADP-forming)
MTAMDVAADVHAVLRAVRAKGWAALDEPSGKGLLASFGIGVPAFRVVEGPGGLPEVGRMLRPPYVLKAVAPEIVHKSEFGAVKVGLGSIAAVGTALEAMQATLAGKGISPQRWLVEEMVPSGIECVIGGMTDPEFGPMVMVGLGGMFVEIMGDVVFRICPIERRDAEDMVSELRGLPLLRGARGREPVCVEALIEVLLKLGSADGVLMRCAGEVAEIDINPLIVTRDRAIAVDARFILRRDGRES